MGLPKRMRFVNSASHAAHFHTAKASWMVFAGDFLDVPAGFISDVQQCPVVTLRHDSSTIPLSMHRPIFGHTPDAAVMSLCTEHDRFPTQYAIRYTATLCDDEIDQVTIELLGVVPPPEPQRRHPIALV
jgi:hypothetical protein